MKLNKWQRQKNEEKNLFPNLYICFRHTSLILYSGNFKRCSSLLFKLMWIGLFRCESVGLLVCMPCPCLGFSRWNHGMEVISHPIPLWTVIHCRQCAMDPKGPPSAHFWPFQRWDMWNNLLDLTHVRHKATALSNYSQNITLHGK